MSIRRKPPRRLKRQVREPEYLAWLHTQPCVACMVRAQLGFAFDGAGRVEADHGSGHGTGQRNSDAMALPLCVRHHREPGWTVLDPFILWPKIDRREFMKIQRVVHRTRWAAAQLVDYAECPF